MHPSLPTGSTAIATDTETKDGERPCAPANWKGVNTLLAKNWRTATDTDESSAEFWRQMPLESSRPRKSAIDPVGEAHGRALGGPERDVLLRNHRDPPQHEEQ